ncbi:MAG: septum formation initiator family protein [Oscillospiraceae bacterium]|nr:septum formation initiator family protein [Oscillospiraceae bacterium]
MLKGKAGRILLWVAFLILAINMTFSVVDRQMRKAEAERALSALSARIHAEERRQGLLRKELAIIGSDEYIERIARTHFGMVRPGEKVFIDMGQ